MRVPSRWFSRPHHPQKPKQRPVSNLARSVRPLAFYLALAEAMDSGADQVPPTARSIDELATTS